MGIFPYIYLFILGIMFGSFASVVIYRLQSGETGILNGRSHCNSCNKILKSLDLIPIFSWLINKAKCRYCKKKISSIYPLLELSTGSLFALIGYFLIDFNLIYNGNINEVIKLIFWLFIGFISIIYTFYDILFLEIHEGVLVSAIWIAILGIITQSFGYLDIIPSFTIFMTNAYLETSLSLLILITSIVGLYIIMLKGLHEIWDILILVFIGFAIYLFDTFVGGNSMANYTAISSLIGAYSIFIFFFLQILISRGKWMGGGDLRIAILIGVLLGHELIAPGIFITYLVGSIIGIIFIIYSKIKNKGGKIENQIPFGPFLATGFFISIFFQYYILNLLEIYF